MRNTEITEPVRLLDDQGFVETPGFAKKYLWNYNRKNLKASHIQMKEWDYYLVMCENFAAAFTISDLGYIRMGSVSFLDFETNEDYTGTVLAHPSLRFKMPDEPDKGVSEIKSGPLHLRFESGPNGKHVYCVFKKFHNNCDFKADVWFSDLPEESMNIAIPFEEKHRFYLNHKMNCMPCTGKVVFDWHVYRFDPKKDLGVMDWGRGLWPYKSTWYWATASTMVKGKPFGFNLGCGFGDTSAASENMLFYKGKAHKLDDVSFEIPEDPMQPWTITSSDGRFEGVFQPDLDRNADINLGVVRSKQHQYFGRMNGTAILDSGSKIKMENIRCAIEVIENRY